MRFFLILVLLGFSALTSFADTFVPPPAFADCSGIMISVDGPTLFFFLTVRRDGSASLAKASMMDGICPAKTFEFQKIYEDLSNHLEAKNNEQPFQYEICFYPANSHYVFPNGYINDKKIIRDLFMTFKAHASFGAKEDFEKLFPSD